MLLTNLKIEKSRPKEKSYKLNDGDGLHIVIQPNGKKYWRLRYRFGPKEKTLSIGKYPQIGLADARLRKIEAKEQLRNNIDPSLHKQFERQAAVIKHDHSFEAIAREWFETNQHTWTPKHATKLWRRLEIHVIPYLGSRSVADILPRDLLTVLRQVQATGATEMTHRLLWICSRVFKFAVVIEATQQNPALNLSEGLKPHRTEHHPVITVSELPDFLRAFAAIKCRQQDRLAFRLLLLTVLRTGELRHSKWGDVNFDTAELRVRKEVMKMKDEHIVPLSRQALTAFRELHKLTGHQEWLLPNSCPRINPVMSENVINLVIKKMGYKGRMVGHSFRALFSTILNEHELHSDAIERQLSHFERNAVKAAYNRAQHLGIRKQLMQYWADYLDTSSRGRSTLFHINPCLDPTLEASFTQISG
ncbi:MAG: integrase arm-type DNA-binding domain-containing protein [Verrucomicrobiota bacterium]